MANWSGDAADAFHKEMSAFEEALEGEAADMDRIAALLEAAAETCAEAEQLMIDLLVEIVRAAPAAAATTATSNGPGGMPHKATIRCHFTDGSWAGLVSVGQAWQQQLRSRFPPVPGR